MWAKNNPAKFWTPGSTLRIAFLNCTQAFKDETIAAASNWLPHINLKFDFVEGEEGERGQERQVRSDEGDQKEFEIVAPGKHPIEQPVESEFRHLACPEDPASMVTPRRLAKRQQFPLHLNHAAGCRLSVRQALAGAAASWHTGGQAETGRRDARP